MRGIKRSFCSETECREVLIKYGFDMKDHMTAWGNYFLTSGDICIQSGSISQCKVYVMYLQWLVALFFANWQRTNWIFSCQAIHIEKCKPVIKFIGNLHLKQ